MKTPDVLISIAILAMLALAIWTARRSGAANPVGTGRLQRDVSVLRGDVRKAQSDIAEIRKDLDAAPSLADLEVLKTDIAASRREMELIGKAADRTEQAVVRIEQLLMDRALPVNRRNR